MGQDWGKPQKKRIPGPAKQRNKTVSCFHASTRVRIFTIDRGISEYKRMDKLVKGDKLCTRRFRRNKSGPGQGHVSIVECVMTFACQLGGQQLMEVEGNLLTLDHYVARGSGPWMTAGKPTQEFEPQTSSASVVYNITLQDGDHTELGNKIYAATLELASTQLARRRHPHTRRKMQDISKACLSIPRDTFTGPLVQPRWTSMGYQHSNREQAFLREQEQRYS